jgi:phospholipase/carboxylesterase
MASSGNPHLTTPLRRAGAAPTQTTRAAVLVHGRGQDPEFMLDVATRIGGMDEWYCVLPAAAENSWYPGRFMDPVEENEPWLTYALEAVDSSLAALAADGFTAERTALIGFSQGACLLAEHLLRQPQPYAAVALLTGGYIGPEGLDRTVTGTLPGTPILLSSSRVDEWVPPSRVKETAALLTTMGASVTVTIHDAAVHGVDDSEARAVRALLDATSA